MRRQGCGAPASAPMPMDKSRQANAGAGQLKTRVAPRRHAKSERTGKPRQAAAVRGYAVCQMHGAGGGAPGGNRNALKHGAKAADARDLVSEVRELARMTHATVAEIEKERAGHVRLIGPCWPTAMKARRNIRNPRASAAVKSPSSIAKGISGRIRMAPSSGRRESRGLRPDAFHAGHRLRPRRRLQF